MCRRSGCARASSSRSRRPGRSRLPRLVNGRGDRIAMRMASSAACSCAGSMSMSGARTSCVGCEAALAVATGCGARGSSGTPEHHRNTTGTTPGTSGTPLEYHWNTRNKCTCARESWFRAGDRPPRSTLRIASRIQVERSLYSVSSVSRGVAARVILVGTPATHDPVCEQASSVHAEWALAGSHSGRVALTC